ncbi:protein O-mannosyl-transferase family [Paraliomyxa miuraensis]|uniref:protein O-mannosyl-transferase family n=1 Tax=Paraliomyxa miuraensis TaxID=376150 RepID=UPI00224D7017|nr:DUF2723 domain-containing protein [Paraliomyxa miuraensis]MCX4245389.1 DUF2723 domain-containing protein [Paraliomyxa miuraensis]
MRAPWLAAWLAFVVLAIGASPASFWLDAGEIGAAGFDLGVAHPPGAPGLLMLLRLTTLVPLGSLGFRMALCSCALGAVAVGLVVAVLQRRGAGPALASIAGLWVLAGLTFVRQGRVVEVYALAVALLMVTLWGLDPAVPAPARTGRRLLAVGAATWAAWCFGDLRLALAPLVIVVWIGALRRGVAWARWAPLVVAMASLVVLTLPFASVGAPTLDWGDPDTLPAMVDQLAARSIRNAFADEILPASASLWLLHTSEALTRISEDLGAPGAVVAAVCLGLAWRRDPAEPTAATGATAAAITWLVGVEAFYAIGINPMGGADRQTGLPLALLAALAVGDVARRWLRDRGRLRWAVLPLLGTVLLLPPALLSGPDLAVTRSWAPHAWSRAALAQLPPGSLLLTQSDDLAAGVSSARLLEGARPDVVSIPAQHLHRPTPEVASPQEAAIWGAAHDMTDETGRIVAAVGAHAGPVALESPRAGLFVTVPWWSEHGRLPLRIAGPGAETMRTATPPEEIEAWLPRLPSAEDRRRLAVGLADWARALVRQGAPIAMAGATLELSLSQVDERHPSALVTLAALRERAGDRAGAIALTRRALELEPGRHAALLNLALYLSLEAETRAEAVALAERAVALRPWKADGWARLQQVRAAAGDEAGAAEAAVRARTTRD